MVQFAHLAQRLFNVPLAIRAEKAEIVMAALSDRLGISRICGASGMPLSMEAWDGMGQPSKTKRDAGYDIVGGVAVIQIYGTLVKKLGSLRPYSGMTGYDGIRQNFVAAMIDPDVKAIMLDIDSPGGEVAGCFDLADTIFNARGEKPIWAILNEGAYSAAYALASAADKIVAPRTGGVGSIGVIMMHVDWSKALDQAGFKVTFITHGERKADFHPEIPLSDEARADAQKSINETGELFVKTVARNRGVSEEAVRKTQARCYSAAQGVEIGLADKVLPPDAAFEELLKSLN